MSQDDHFLARWSRRKHEAGRKTEEKPAEAAVAPPVAEPAPPPPLPPVESLTPESDFAPFMKSEVDPSIRQQALRTLFRDPRFNVMDGLDVYIDDYSKPDPLPEGWLEKLNQVERLGDYSLKQAEEAKARESAAAGPDIAGKTEGEQQVASSNVDTPADTSNKEESPPEVGESDVNPGSNPRPLV